MITFIVVLGYTLVIAVDGIHRYALGLASWEIIPTSVGLVTIVAANLYAFFAITSRNRQSNHAIERTADRGTLDF